MWIRVFCVYSGQKLQSQLSWSLSKDSIVLRDGAWVGQYDSVGNYTAMTWLQRVKGNEEWWVIYLILRQRREKLCKIFKQHCITKKECVKFLINSHLVCLLLACIIDLRHFIEIQITFPLCWSNVLDSCVTSI